MASAEERSRARRKSSILSIDGRNRRLPVSAGGAGRPLGCVERLRGRSRHPREEKEDVIGNLNIGGKGNERTTFVGVLAEVHGDPVVADVLDVDVRSVLERQRCVVGHNPAVIDGDRDVLAVVVW